MTGKESELDKAMAEFWGDHDDQALPRVTFKKGVFWLLSQLEKEPFTDRDGTVRNSGQLLDKARELCGKK